jgi:outer membrane lipoprotein-sorting protein
MHINNIFLVILLALGNLTLSAQDFTVCSAPETHVAAIKSKQSQTKNLTANYVDEKHLLGFKEVQEGKGNFYFQAKNSIRIEQETPQKIIYISNDSKSKLMIDGKEISNQGQLIIFNQIKKITVSLMNGSSISSDESFEQTYLINATSFRLVLAPLDGRMKKHISKIVLTFDLQNYDLQTLEMHEKSGNWNKMIFQNTKYNSEIDNTLFRNF